MDKLIEYHQLSVLEMTACTIIYTAGVHTIHIVYTQYNSLIYCWSTYSTHGVHTVQQSFILLEYIQYTLCTHSTTLFYTAGLHTVHTVYTWYIILYCRSTYSTHSVHTVQQSFIMLEFIQYTWCTHSTTDFYSAGVHIYSKNDVHRTHRTPG